MNEIYIIYTARSQPDNRDIRITGGRITEVQLYFHFLKERQQVQTWVSSPGKLLTLICMADPRLDSTVWGICYGYGELTSDITNMTVNIFSVIILFQDPRARCHQARWLGWGSSSSDPRWQCRQARRLARWRTWTHRWPWSRETWWLVRWQKSKKYQIQERKRLVKGFVFKHK